MQNQGKTQGLWTPRVAEDDDVGGEDWGALRPPLTEVIPALQSGCAHRRALYWISYRKIRNCVTCVPHNVTRWSEKAQLPPTVSNVPLVITQHGLGR